MSDTTPTRRQFLSAAGTVAAGVTLAGCTGDDDGAGSGEFDVTARIVSDAPKPLNENPSEVTPNVTPANAEALSLNDVLLQRAGPKGILVSGDVSNDADESFSEILIESQLYDSREGETVYNSIANQTRHDGLPAGEQWQWAVKFTDDPVFTIDYYAVTARGRY